MYVPTNQTARVTLHKAKWTDICNTGGQKLTMQHQTMNTSSDVMCNNSTTEYNCSVPAIHTAGAGAISQNSNTILVTKSVLGAIGVISNGIVIIVFASNKKYRKKIPVMFMINQVRKNKKENCKKSLHLLCAFLLKMNFFCCKNDNILCAVNQKMEHFCTCVCFSECGGSILCSIFTPVPNCKIF